MCEYDECIHSYQTLFDARYRLQVGDVNIRVNLSEFEFFFKFKIMFSDLVNYLKS